MTRERNLIFQNKNRNLRSDVRALLTFLVYSHEKSHFLVYGILLFKTIKLPETLTSLEKSRPEVYSPKILVHTISKNTNSAVLHVDSILKTEVSFISVSFFGQD